MVKREIIEKRSEKYTCRYIHLYVYTCRFIYYNKYIPWEIKTNVFFITYAINVIKLQIELSHKIK